MNSSMDMHNVVGVQISVDNPVVDDSSVHDTDAGVGVQHHGSPYLDKQMSQPTTFPPAYTFTSTSSYSVTDSNNPNNDHDKVNDDSIVDNSSATENTQVIRVSDEPYNKSNQYQGQDKDISVNNKQLKDYERQPVPFKPSTNFYNPSNLVGYSSFKRGSMNSMASPMSSTVRQSSPVGISLSSGAVASSPSTPSTSVSVAFNSTPSLGIPFTSKNNLDQMIQSTHNSSNKDGSFSDLYRDDTIANDSSYGFIFPSQTRIINTAQSNMSLPLVSQPEKLVPSNTASRISRNSKFTSRMNRLDPPVSVARQSSGLPATSFQARETILSSVVQTRTISRQAPQQHITNSVGLVSSSSGYPHNQIMGTSLQVPQPLQNAPQQSQMAAGPYHQYQPGTRNNPQLDGGGRQPRSDLIGTTYPQQHRVRGGGYEEQTSVGGYQDHINPGDRNYFTNNSNATTTTASYHQNISQVRPGHPQGVAPHPMPPLPPLPQYIPPPQPIMRMKEKEEIKVIHFGVV